VIAVGIDCATTTGWAIVERTGGRETLRGHGIIKFNTPHVWKPIAWLALQARPWGGPWPDVVAIELPWLGKNPHTLEVLARYCGRFEQAFTSTPTRLVKASEWQSKILGRFGGKKRAGLKRAAVLWVKGTFGVDVSDDEADAIGLAVYALRFP
jgi:Holliday junction resolvasome RuvABC endonuclease subunit